MFARAKRRPRRDSPLSLLCAECCGAAFSCPWGSRALAPQAETRQEWRASRQLIFSVLLGCLLFYIAIAAVNTMNLNTQRDEHLHGITSTFREIYENSSDFLTDPKHTELFFSDKRENQDALRYLISQYNVSALVELQLIGRFIGILRYSINNTKHNVTVEEDLRHLQDYLVIQSTRFGSNFSYTIKIGEDCREFIIPKLLLQPLLENSIKYGFKKKPSIHIEVRGWCRADALYFSVKDNGGGVEEETLVQLRELLQSEEINIEHNGLQNINRRIRLGYGGDSGLTIDSTEGKGFSVLLKL